MLFTDQIIRIITESGLAVGSEASPEVIRTLTRNQRTYQAKELPEFKRDLQEACQQSGLQLLEYRLKPDEIRRLLLEPGQMILLFHREADRIEPRLILPKGRKSEIIHFLETRSDTFAFRYDQLSADFEDDGLITVWSLMKQENLVSPQLPGTEPPTPLWRLLHLLFTEKRDILYIFIYAVFIGLISLVIPLGIQTTIELVSGGVFFSSIYIMIGGVIVGVLISGGMQVFQLSLVEYLQRRIFTRAAFEFAYRFPHIASHSIQGVYAPGLVNRFFDVLTIQKGLPKFLIEFSGAGLQILFGLLLLSLYHPFFVFFGLGLIGFLAVIFYLTGTQALKTSIKESTYKYKLIHWLEDIARLHQTLKLTGTTTLPVSRTDFFVNNYLKNRKSHFRILLAQFTYIVVFKALIIGGLLIIGTILVVSREITLGQFVASEVIIILILNSVEKIIMYMDVIYDLLTAVDKIGAVTDLPTERRGGLDMTDTSQPFAISLVDVRSRQTVHGIDMTIKPGERVCISGPSGSGKTALAELMAGLHADYTGGILVNGYSIRDLDLTYYRDHLAANGPEHELFEGTLLDNVMVGNPKINTNDVLEVLDRVGLKDTIAAWPHGIDTELTSAGEALGSGLAHRIILARCLARKPRLFLLSDYFTGVSEREKATLLGCVFSEKEATVICFSNDPVVMAACSRTIVLNKGRVEADGPFSELLVQGKVNHLLPA